MLSHFWLIDLINHFIDYICVVDSAPQFPEWHSVDNGVCQFCWILELFQIWWFAWWLVAVSRCWIILRALRNHLCLLMWWILDQLRVVIYVTDCRQFLDRAKSDDLCLKTVSWIILRVVISVWWWVMYWRWCQAVARRAHVPPMMTLTSRHSPSS